MIVVMMMMVILLVMKGNLDILKLHGISLMLDVFRNVGLFARENTKEEEDDG